MALACVGAAAAGCATLPSSSAYLASTPEKAEEWIQECEANYNDMLRKERFCSIAIRSEHVTDLDRSFAYATRGTLFYETASNPNADPDWAMARVRDAVADFDAALRITPDNPLVLENRGNAHLVLGNDRLAQADFRAVERLTGDSGPREYAQWWAEERRRERERLQREYEARRRFAVRFEGIWCGAVQGDSIFNEENEIRVHTLVYGDGVAPAGSEKPSSDATFWGVTPGYRSERGRGDIWVGPAGEVDLSVILWEHDNGGELIDFAAFAAVNAGFAFLTRSAPVRGYQPASAGAPIGPADLAADLVDDVVADILKDVFGTHNDHMGTHHWTDLDVAYYATLPTQVENGFTHHIATQHRQYGANCKTYYSFRETDPAA